MSRKATPRRKTKRAGTEAPVSLLPDVTPLPQAPRFHTRLETHGDVRVDPYFWLRDKEHPETMKYLEAENSHYEKTLKPLEKFRGRLFLEMKNRVKEDDSTPPAPWGDYEYYTRFKKGLQYSIKCRRRKGSKQEEVLLDENKLAKGHKYFSLGGFSTSPNQQLLAYATDTDGSEKYTVRFRDFTTNKDFDVVIPNTSGDVMWANDNQTVFYTVLDDNLRPHKVFRHQLGTSTTADELVFEEKSPEFFLGVDKSASDKYIFIETHAKNSSEVYVLDADAPTGKLRLVHPRTKELEYHLEHQGDYFYIQTNAGRATNFKIMRTPVDKLEKRNWTEFWPHKPGVLLGGFLCFEKWIVLFEHEKANPQVRVIAMPSKKSHLIQFDEPAYTVSSHVNLEYETDDVRLAYASMTQPACVYDYHMTTRRKTIRKEQEVRGYRKKDYVSERTWVKGHDGVKIPLTLVYKKGFKKNGQAPAYLYAYGSYGSNMPASFSTTRLSLLERGFVYAIAHIRGGQEMGRAWYEDGKFLNKKNTFEDFVSCASFLATEGWTSPSRLVIAGGSAGGMLMGAVMNMRPDLFLAAAAHVPFVDVLNTMLDSTLPLTQMEYNEWGNPADKKYYNYIKSYSPYDNIEEKDYPHLFVTAGISDPRVTYWEPAKWVARLRAMKTGTQKIIFKTNMGGGHFGASGRFEILKEFADEYAFFLALMGIKK